MPAFAQNQAVEDSVYTLQGEPKTEVIIASQKSIFNFYETSLKSETATDLLQRQSATTLKSYYNGGLSTLSYRGTNAQQSKIQWNGFDINSPFLGLFDLSMLPVFDTKTAYLKAYNHQAIGQTLSVAQDVGKMGNLLQLSLEIGDFGKTNLSTVATMAQKNEQGSFKQAIKILHREADNNYAYRQNEEWQTLQNAAFNFKDYQYSAIFNQQKKRYALSFDTWLQDYFRQVPFATPNAAQRDFNSRNTLLFNFQPKKISGHVHAAAAFFRETIEYNGDFSWLNAWMLQTKFVQAFDDTSKSYPRKKQSVILSSWEVEMMHRYNQAFTPYYATTKQQQLTQLQALLRMKSTRFGENLTVKLLQEMSNGNLFLPNWNVELNKNFDRFTLQILQAHNTRIPTLNDMFWQPLGNPNLKAENGFSNEIKMAYSQYGGTKDRAQLRRRYLHAGLAVFHKHINNYIQWQAQMSGSFAPKNLKKVQILGFEPYFNYKINYKNGYFYSYNAATFTQAKNIASHLPNDASVGKQLLYVPYFKINFNTEFAYKNTKLQVFYTQQGKQFANTSNTNEVAGFGVADIALQQVWNYQGGNEQQQGSQKSISMLFSVSNLFNKNYETYINRPAPGRNYSITLKFIFDEKTNF